MNPAITVIEQMIGSYLSQLQVNTKLIAEKNQSILRLTDENAELEKNIAQMRSALRTLRSTDS